MEDLELEALQEQGLNVCDCCGAIERSIDLFWSIDWDEHTPKQEKVLAYMRKNGFEAICEVCFHDKVEG